MVGIVATGMKKPVDDGKLKRCEKVRDFVGIQIDVILVNSWPKRTIQTLRQFLPCYNELSETGHSRPRSRFL